MAPIVCAILCLAYLSIAGTDDRTLVCDYCGKPITDSYVVSDSGRFHESCYEDHVAPRCAVCGQIIDGEYLIDHWGNVAHAYHRGNVPQCQYCNRFISEYTTGGGFRYRDGRIVCKVCDNQAITKNDEARRLMEHISGILKRHGIEIAAADVPLHLVDRKEMARLRDDESDAPHGFTYVEKTILAGGIVIDKKFEIYMLTSMPRMHFIATLAHELMHVWLHENAPDEIDSRLCEGSCNYAAFLVLENYTGKEAEYIRETMKADPDHTYGEGYRRVAEFVAARGVGAWLAYLRKNAAPPW